MSIVKGNSAEDTECLQDDKPAVVYLLAVLIGLAALITTCIYLGSSEWRGWWMVIVLLSPMISAFFIWCGLLIYGLVHFYPWARWGTLATVAAACTCWGTQAAEVYVDASAKHRLAWWANTGSGEFSTLLVVLIPLAIVLVSVFTALTHPGVKQAFRWHYLGKSDIADYYTRIRPPVISVMGMLHTGIGALLLIILIISSNFDDASGRIIFIAIPAIVLITGIGLLDLESWAHSFGSIWCPLLLCFSLMVISLFIATVWFVFIPYVVLWIWFFISFDQSVIKTAFMKRYYVND